MTSHSGERVNTARADEVAAETPVIEIDNVEKEYQAGDTTFLALRGVSLRVNRGEFVAIIGPSGSGKSTLMNVIGCLDRPTRGEYRLAGHEVGALDTEGRAFVRGQMLGFIFQGFNLLARTSALENVEMPMIYRGVPGTERRRRAVEALTRVGIGNKLDNTVTQLSGGQQQRVAIARALVTEPQLLLADEPTGNLDSRTTEEILTLLQTLNRERGLTIVMVTHDPEVAAKADRVITVRDGVVESDRVSDERRPAAARPMAPLVAPDASGGSSMFAWFMAVRLALRALSRNKLRGGLTVLGILIGVAAVVTMSALGAGAKQQMEAQLATLGTNVLIVYPGATAAGGVRGAQGSSTRLTEDDARAITNEVYAVSAVAPMLQTNAQVVAEGRNASTRVIGTTPDYFVARAWSAASGTLFDTGDVRSATRSCVIGQTVRATLFDDGDAVGRSIRVGALPCTVTAVLTAKGQSGGGQDQDDVIIVPLSTYRAQIGRQVGNAVSTITVAARDPQLIYRAQDAITELLRQRHRIAEGAEDDFTVRNMQDLAASVDAQRNTMTMLLLVVASISLLIGGIGVMNIMLVSVTERTREIGTRLAIGARGADILSQFLVEAVVLAALGGLAGLGIGVGASYLLGHTTGWRTAIQPDSAAVAVIVASAIGIVFGFFPARRAAHLDPIVALRHE